MTEWASLRIFLENMLNKLQNGSLTAEEIVYLNFCKNKIDGERVECDEDDDLVRVFILGMVANYALKENKCL
jgi:hypothetical protein